MKDLLGDFESGIEKGGHSELPALGMTPSCASSIVSLDMNDLKY